MFGACCEPGPRGQRGSRNITRTEVSPVKTPSHPLFRDILALVIVALTCPIAVFGGANLGCVGSASFSGSCAMTVIVASPLILIVGGAIAGVLSRGWTGLLISLVGMVIGMFSILGLSMLAGKPVPVDFFSGVFATVFFGVPIAIGYGIGRVIVRLLATRAS